MTTINSHILDEKLAAWRKAAKDAAYNREHDKGTAFERLCRVFLEHDEDQRKRFVRVLTWAEWAKERGQSEVDRGIDLMAELRHETDQWCAVQCKCYVKGKTMRESDLSSFLSNSAGQAWCAERMVIDTTEKEWASGLKEAVKWQVPELYRITIRNLRESSVNWETYFQRDRVEMQRRELKVPRDYQAAAIQNVLHGLEEEGSRGRLIMACGTGKTFTSLCIAKELVGRGGQVLYLIPSLALMSQTIREWSRECTAEDNLRAFAVCSDTQVGKPKKQDGDYDMAAGDLAYPATTNAARLAEKVLTGDRETFTVIFATYQSIKVIHQAQQEYGLGDFDLAICDEAHRTCGVSGRGKKESYFVRIHDQDYVRADRRLYMTATPKMYSPRAHRKVGDYNMSLCDMGDVSVFGEELYRIGFGEAIDRGILSDFRVVVFAIPHSVVAAALGEVLGEHELTLDEGGKLIGCWRAMAKLEVEEFLEDPGPMKRLIAYCRDIKTSRKLSERFEVVRQKYSGENEGDERGLPEHAISAQHVDGTFDAGARTGCLDWLGNLQDGDDTSHVLFNCRCLSEGVDVPALDGVMFMHPRRSQFEIAQAVGRVLRKPGQGSKRFGYILLPVVVPDGGDPEKQLADSRSFGVVWQVIEGMRAHDERFSAEINLIERGQESGKIKIIAVKGRTKGQTGRNGKETITVSARKQDGGQQELFMNHELAGAIRAMVIRKHGSRNFWKEWSGDIAEITQKHIARITEWTERTKSNREIFREFLDEIRDDLNEGITEKQAIEMLASQMVTGPVFNALLGDSQFVEENPISKGMQLVLDLLAPEHLSAESDGLEGFYESVGARARGATTPAARQSVIKDLYDTFFQRAFPENADKYGIAYTPIELVDFILHSVDGLLRKEFGQSLSSEGVEILDPFTGTGTFITRMIQSGLIAPEDLPRKYRSEIRANEIMLLAYYIAATNIERAYHEAVGAADDAYEHFPGILLTDTFGMHEGDDMIAGVLPDNSKRIERQKKADITVIIGNPPWRAGQKKQNDAAKNQAYPLLRGRIENSYAYYSNASSKRNLYDSYVLAIRWASDRIGESGVIGFVTNGSWLDGNAMDGMRKCLADEFSSIYVLNLRGNMQSGGREAGENVFESVWTVDVAVTLFVKNQKHPGCRILYYDIGDYLSREEKIRTIKQFRGLGGVGEWAELKPNMHNDWLNQRDTGFGKFLAIGSKDSHAVNKIFKNYSLGVATGRDAWCYNFSEAALRENIRRMIEFYNEERDRLAGQGAKGREWTKSEIDKFVNNDPRKISWTVNLKGDLSKNKALNFEEGRITATQYRPFTQSKVYFSRRLNERVYQIPQIFPHEEAENQLICVTGKGETDDFSCLMVKEIPNLHTIASGQCFPRWLYSRPKEDKASLFAGKTTPDTDAYGYVRESSFTDTAVQTFNQKMGGGEIPSPKMTCSTTSTAYSMSPPTGQNMPQIFAGNCPGSLSPKMLKSSICLLMQEESSERCILDMRRQNSIRYSSKSVDGNRVGELLPGNGSV